MKDKSRRLGSFVSANTQTPVLALSLTRCLVENHYFVLRKVLSEIN